MCGCENRHRDCDDAVLDWLNGVDGRRPVGRRCVRDGGRREEEARILSDPCGNGWTDVCESRKERRCCCDFCWLRCHCPYFEDNRFRN